jgi:hypothetical protein
MKPEQDIYDKIIYSMEGSSKAKPDAGLFQKIESAIYNYDESKNIYQFKLLIAASVILLIVNILFIGNKLKTDSKTDASSIYTHSLTVPLNIYDYE